MLIIIQKLYPS
uniref:Uncharacterized protein n=1 Tax=Arundo donax TaxID=35708 RepID=A0A0A8ZRC1_ARUDO